MSIYKVITTPDLLQQICNWHISDAKTFIAKNRIKGLLYRINGINITRGVLESIVISGNLVAVKKTTQIY